MFFSKKQRLRAQEDERLIQLIEDHKHSLDSQQQLIRRSVEPSEDVLQRKKITDSLYSFLLREARARHATKDNRVL
ncbi:YaaL family protein [Alkalihalobacillus oceani]|uniref:YaaL family protein n=1 Tax=Halalkalibacter oceani TaxID=1653776 RepID=UPI00203D85DA|nr:YaaL family protein [Halalkalibacter oceani]MCM3763212.1 YaaL family protein [Halalkalibacter oceani]